MILLFYCFWNQINIFILGMHQIIKSLADTVADIKPLKIFFFNLNWIESCSP